MSPKNSKNPKKRPEASTKELTSMVTKLRAELERSEARVARLKSKVGGLRDGKAELEKQVSKLTKKLERTAAPPTVTSVPIGATPVASATPPSDVPGPSWTVAQLRSEVEARGTTGVPARATKAQLLAVLAPAPTTA